MSKCQSVKPKLAGWPRPHGHVVTVTYVSFDTALKSKDLLRISPARPKISKLNVESFPCIAYVCKFLNRLSL